MRDPYERKTIMSNATFQLMSAAIMMVVMLLPALTIIGVATLVLKMLKRLINVFGRN